MFFTYTKEDMQVGRGNPEQRHIEQWLVDDIVECFGIFYVVSMPPELPPVSLDGFDGSLWKLGLFCWTFLGLLL